MKIVDGDGINYSCLESKNGKIEMKMRIVILFIGLITLIRVDGQPASNDLPAPWISQDIGTVGLGGSASYTNGTFTVSGLGSDIWGTSDSFQFVYQPWSGDGQIVARVVSIQNTASAAKAGLMFRETLDPGSVDGNVCVTPTSGVSMQNRTVANGSTSNVRTLNGINAPCWLSLVRSGNYLSSYESSDGVTWNSVGTNTIPMATSIYVGLCVTSESNTVLNTSTFDNVVVGAATVVGIPAPMVNVLNYTSNLKITFSGYNQVGGVTNFPVLVRLSTNVPGFSYAQFASPIGADLTFTYLTNLQALPYEIEQWNPAGESIVWVQVPSLSSTNDYIMAYWGNPAQTNAAASNTNGAVWKSPLSTMSDFDLMWHLNQTNFPFTDSMLQNPATNRIAGVSVAGYAGTDLSFNGFTDYLDAGVKNLSNSFTLSVWINISPSVSDIRTIWASKPGFGTANEFAENVNNYTITDGAIRFITGNGSGGSPNGSAGGAILPSFSRNNDVLLCMSDNENAHSITQTLNHEKT